jgi:aminoglycoside phosphotransferase (APT) family kinase protein
LRRVEVGLSRQTWFVDLGSSTVVLRADNPGGVAAVPGSLEHEYELYRRLSDTPLPVARTLWFEADPSILGAKFYLREFVEGTPSPEHFDDPDPGFNDVRIEASREHARKLAMVHRLDWKSLGFEDLLATPAGPETCASVAVERIIAGIREVALEPLPLVELIAQRLLEDPPVAPGVVLCKGSNGAMQEIWRGLEIVGLSDWELASIGDPASDWARCHGYVVNVPGRWDRRRLLDYYQTLSGYHITDEALEYYTNLYRFEMVQVGLHSARALADGAQPDARMTGLASLTVRSLLRQLVAALQLPDPGVATRATLPAGTGPA